MNPQAQELNTIIKDKAPIIFNLLSARGREIFFPKSGILAQAKDAKGKKINATIGIALEDDKTPMRLSAIQDTVNLDPQDIFPYAPSYGLLDLRKKWQSLMFSKNPSMPKNTSLPVVTNALTHGLSIAGYLFLDCDDEIFMPDLFWGNYRLIFERAYGAKIKTFNTFRNNVFDVYSMRGALMSEGEKKVLLLNFPNNPCGYTPTEDETEEIASAIKECADAGKEILVITDDAYFGLVYEDGIYKESLFSKLADVHENVLVIKVDGPTKEDYVWGLRVGFLTYANKAAGKEVYEALEAKTAGAIRGNISNDSHLSQSIMLKAFGSNSYMAEKESKFRILKGRYEEVRRILAQSNYSDYFEPLPFNSGYFMCIRLKEGVDSEIVRKTLIEKYDSGVIATPGLIRVAFSSVPESDLKELFENIYSACKENF